MEFLLFVGTDHQLADNEVKATIPKAHKIHPGIYSFQSKNQNLAVKLISRLGSAIKLLSYIAPWNNQEESLGQYVTSQNFSLFFYPPDSNRALKLSKAIKAKIDSKPRFVLSKEKWGLSPLIIKKQKISELFINADCLWQTVWVQDYLHWIEKDRRLPFANARVGLLPPKIARIMVNLPGVSATSSKVLLDPFCGSGRILVEAVELGFHAIGADLSISQIEQTQKNLEYLKTPKSQYQLLKSDATQISRLLPKNSIDLIVTEPFLGRSHPRPDRIPDLVKGLKKLYLGALKNWQSILKPQAKVVMVFPQIKTAKQVLITSSVIDDSHLLGYNVKTRNLIYSRPDASIMREIVILEKNKNIK